MISTKASALSEPTPGWVISRCAAGHFSASYSIACFSSVIVGLSRSSNSQQITSRRLAHGLTGRPQAKLNEVKVEVRRRMHHPIPAVGQWLRSLVAGHNRYYGVPMND
jgi:hypothetical protein